MEAADGKRQRDEPLDREAFRASLQQMTQGVSVRKMDARAAGALIQKMDLEVRLRQLRQSLEGVDVHSQ